MAEIVIHIPVLREACADSAFFDRHIVLFIERLTVEAKRRGHTVTLDDDANADFFYDIRETTSDQDAAGAMALVHIAESWFWK